MSRLRQVARDRLGGFHQPFCRHHSVQEASGEDRRWVEEHLGVVHLAPVEELMGSAEARFLYAPNPALCIVMPDFSATGTGDLERPISADSVVGRKQDERTLARGEAGTGDDDRIGVRQHATRKEGAGADQIRRVLRAGLQHLERS